MCVCVCVLCVVCVWCGVVWCVIERERERDDKGHHHLKGEPLTIDQNIKLSHGEKNRAFSFVSLLHCVELDLSVHVP